MKIDGAVVLWSVDKQTGVPLLTMEAKFIAASRDGRELLGLRQFFQEPDFKIAEPMKMKVDNQAAIKQLESKRVRQVPSMWIFVSSLYATTLMPKLLANLC